MFSSPSLVGGSGFAFACRYHLWMIPQATLFWSVANRPPIFASVVLTHYRQPSCKETCNFLVAVRRNHWYTGKLCLRAVHWYTSWHVSSDIHSVLSWSVHRVFLKSFQRSTNPASSSHTGTLFGETMGQVDITLIYLWLLSVLQPLSLARIIC